MRSGLGCVLVLLGAALGHERAAGPMGRYIVHFSGRVSATGSLRAERHVRSAPNGSVGLIRHRFGKAFEGMVAELSDEAVKHFQASGAEVMVDIPVYAAATASWGEYAVSARSSEAVPCDWDSACLQGRAMHCALSARDSLMFIARFLAFALHP